MRALLLIFLVLTGCASTRPGDAAPPLVFQPVQGEGVEDLDTFRGRIVLVNLWATWCAPCIVEMPALARLQEADPDGLAVVFLSDEPPELVRAFLADRDFAGTFGTVEAGRLDPPYDLARRLRPVTFILAPDGRLLETVQGARDEAFFAERVAAYR